MGALGHPWLIFKNYQKERSIFGRGLRSLILVLVVSRGRLFSGVLAPRPRARRISRPKRMAIVTAKGVGLHSMKAKVQKTVLNGRAKLVSTCL